jgi:hypothetical protein
MVKNNIPEEFFLDISGLKKHPVLNRPLLKDYTIDETTIASKRWKRQCLSAYKNWIQGRYRYSFKI